LLPLLSALGLWLFSNGVGALNQVIRKRDTDKVPVSPALRFVASVLNAMAGNIDKTREQAAIAQGAASPRPADPVAKLDPTKAAP
jgi:hypothetical protein